MNVKPCTACKEYKPVDAFLKPHGVSQKVTKTCDVCRQKSSQEYYKNLEKRQTQAREYRRLNSAYYRDVFKNWSDSNKEHSREYARHRMKNSPAYRAIRSEQTRPASWIKLKRRSPHNEAAMGCTIEIFRAHIEAQFHDGMTWENYGKVWQFDHYFPMTPAYKYGDEIFKMAARYENIRPLLSDKNLSKGFSIPEDSPITQLIITKGLQMTREIDYELDQTL